MPYLDLRLERVTGRKFRIAVQRSPAGDAPELETQLDLAWRPFSSASGRDLCPPSTAGQVSASRVEARLVGRQVFQAIFNGAIARCFEQSLAQGQPGLPLVVRLRLGDDPALQEFPWEVLWDPRLDEPLAVAKAISLVRYSEAARPAQPSAAAGPLRILFVAWQPPNGEPLEVAKEWQIIAEAIRAAAKRGAVDLLRANETTLAGVRREFSDRGCHVLHFVGHGEVAGDGRGAVLLFESELGGTDRVSGERLAAAMLPGEGGGEAFRLAVLNACHGARAGQADPRLGMAQSLVGHGLPAAIAMRCAVGDRPAILFARALYEALADGGTLAQAVNLARRELFVRVDDLSWLAPVLFLRAEDRRLIAPAASRRLRSLARPLVLAGVLAALAGMGWLSVPARESLVAWLQSLRARLPRSSAELIGHPSCPSPHGVSFGFAFVEPGVFAMGSEHDPDSQPVRSMAISRPFCLARTELTEEQWEALMGDGRFSQQTLLGRPARGLPKTGLSWEDVNAFVAQANHRLGHEVFFVPSEAQWEYAARAGSAGRYSFGDDEARLRFFGNCGGQGDRDGFAELAPVATFEPNRWGFYDMHGNVSEWVADWSGVYDPEVTSDAEGPGHGVERVRRGGSFISRPENCESAARATAQPETRRPEFGFRIARWPTAAGGPAEVSRDASADRQLNKSSAGRV